MTDFNDENEEVFGWFKKYWFFILGTILLLSVVTFFATRSVQVVDTGLVRYQEFQEIHATCSAIRTKICNLAEVPEDDKMFKDFSKAQQILAQKNNLARWVGEYNAKSQLINFSVWKSKDLPYTLTTEQFNCGK